jgi:S1-C subfamily serine protease
VLGLTVLLLAFAVGAAFSGVVFFSYYEFRKDRTEKRVETFVSGFDQVQKKAKAEIQQELEPLRKLRAEGETLDVLVKKVAPALFFVSTLDEAGQPSVGSAFSVASDADQTLLLTSFNTVRAATRQPGPPVRVRQGDQELDATVWTWHEERDLALLTVAKGSLPTLAFAPERPVKTGERVLALSGLGAAGGAVTQGFVADVSAAGIQHDAAVGPAFQGGPLVDADGRVLGVASRAYAPLNFVSDGVYFAPLIRSACERVLKCPSGTPSGPGPRTAPTRATSTTTTTRPGR